MDYKDEPWPLLQTVISYYVVSAISKLCIYNYIPRPFIDTYI